MTKTADPITGQITEDGASRVTIGSGGGSAAVTQLASFLISGGATQSGTAIPLPNGKNTIQAVANGSSGAFAATVTILVSNDNLNFETLGTMALSGTATTADSSGFAFDAPWAFIRADVSSFSGTGATCIVSLGV